MKNLISDNPKLHLIFTIVLILAVLICGYGLYYYWTQHAHSSEKLKEAIVLTQQQAEDVNYLQNKLNLNKQNSEMLVEAILKAQHGQVQPVTHFTIEAPTIQQAAEKVVERINSKDPTLPKEALEKTDNTLVVPNNKKSTETPYDVAVFKSNNYRNWEWSVGYGQHGDDKYIPVAIQRNFSKDAAISYEYHFGGNKGGYEVKYVRKTDKLFIIF